MSDQQKQQQFGNENNEEDIRSMDGSEWSVEEENIVSIGNAKQKEESNLKIALLEAKNQILEGKLENIKLLAENRALKEESNLNKLKKENKSIRARMEAAEEKANKLESTVKEIQQKMDEAVKEMAIQKMEYQNKMHDLEFEMAQTVQQKMKELAEELTSSLKGQSKMGQQQPTGFGPNNAGIPPPLPPPSESQTRPSDISLIMNKIRDAKTQEEREAMFSDLKKTPYLFNQFLKMTKRPELMSEMSARQQQQMMGQQSTGFGLNNGGISPPLPPSEFSEWLASIMPDPHTNLVSPNDISLIMNKIRDAKTCEEREVMFAEVKKWPHLFNHFLEMTKRSDFITEVNSQKQQQRLQQ